MVAFVVDNSIAVAWLYPNQATEHTPFILQAEFANAANVMVNRGLLSEELGKEMLAHGQGLQFHRGPVSHGSRQTLSNLPGISAVRL